MSVATNYVKALSELTSDISELQNISMALASIKRLQKEKKYNLIISSPIISNEEKLAFIKDIINSDEKKIDNLLKLLSKNGRLEFLPEIAKMLEEHIATVKNDYIGYVYSKDGLSNEKMSQIEKKISEKLNINVKLVQKDDERNGVQVYVDVLGVEISLYEDDIKQRLIDNIIKAI